MTPKEVKAQIDALAKSLKAKGLTSSEVDEATSNLKAMYDDAIEAEEKALDAQISQKEAEIEDKVMSKIDKLFAEEAEKRAEAQKQVSSKAKSIYGAAKDKALNELEGDEKTSQFFKSLINATVSNSPSDWEVVHAMTSERKAKALSEGVDADGGHLVPEEFEMMLIEDLREATVMRIAGATPWQMNRRTLELPKLGSRPQVSWGSENATISTTTADFGNLVLTANKLVSRLYTSTELAEDSTPNVVELLRRLFVTAISEAEDTAFFTGSGTGRPKGLSQETLATVSAGGTLTGDHLITAATAKLGQGYRANSVWFMNPRTWANIMALKDSNNAYLFQAPGNVLDSGAQARLLGRPVFETSNVPSSTIYIGDPSYYYIGDRTGVAVTTSTEADNTFARDQIQIKVRKRVDGRLALSNAFVKITSTGVS